MINIGMSNRTLKLMVVACLCGLLGCQDEALSPEETPPPAPNDPVVLEEGINAYLVASGASEPVGTVITVEAKIRSLEEGETPTAFVASLHYDKSRLEFLESLDLGDGVLRFANPEAAPGVAKVAGAAADGLNTDALFVARMKVLEVGYIEGLALALHELGILERGFAEVVAETHVSAKIITNDSMVVRKP